MTAILLKLQPNQDITEALEQAVRRAGMTRARIIAAVGSLVEGVLLRDDGVEIVDGPAIEVAGLTGEVDIAGATQLQGYLCREDTGVVQGTLVRGRNAVAVTFEFLVEAHDAA